MSKSTANMNEKDKIGSDNDGSDPMTMNRAPNSTSPDCAYPFKACPVIML